MLEAHERAELQDAFAVAGGELTEGTTASPIHICTASVRVEEMRLIEQVFGFPANLEAEAFGELKNSSKAGIKLPNPRSP